MPANICSGCGAEHARGTQRYCAPCHAAYMREWRKTHPLTLEQKKRDTARSYAGEYKRRGKLTPEPCRICGGDNAEMHHPDHELPLLVVWLCREHHLDWHDFWRSVAHDAWKFWDTKSKAGEASKWVKCEAA